jgi:2-C-methyl-D-erythritol 2,4-cyclodiphosphate synthase
MNAVDTVANAAKRMDYRVGYGWDSHEFKRGRPLILGGVSIEHDRGLAGHSDGDVLLHAICDALLGAVALGDIGAHFPSSDSRWRNAASSQFVQHAYDLVSKKGWGVVNIDATLILGEPKIQPHAKRIRESIAKLLNVSVDCVSVKAKTPEGMGTEDAATAHAVALLSNDRKLQAA